jgi:uridine monophosphate synthetase
VDNKELIIQLSKIGGIKFGEFTLKNGMVSPIYIDLRILVSYPKVMKQVAKTYAQLLEGLDFQRMAAVPYSALPIVAAISAVNEKPWIYTRKEVKDYGTKKLIEGEYKAGETIVVVDDMTTDGASKLEVIAPFEKEGLLVKDVVVLLDREQGAAKNLADKGYRLHSVITLSEALKVLSEAKIIDKAMLDKVKKFLAANSS